MGQCKPNSTRPTKFHEEKKSLINDGSGEFWVAATTNNKQIVWLADNGSPGIFMNISTANDLLLHIEKAKKIIPYNQGENFECFSNKQIKSEGVLQIDFR